MADKSLKLNSISRFSKRSQNLILEEHGHCEVPAGCGGAVLRWINPKLGRGCRIKSAVGGERGWEMMLDGGKISTIPFIPYGRHVITMTITVVDTSVGFLMLSCTENTEEDAMHRRTSELPVSDFKLVTTSDSTWHYSLTAPVDEAWMQAGFDDSDWSPLVAKAFSDVSNKYWVTKLSEIGAVELGIEATQLETVTVYVRKEFEVAKP